ncbi:nuclear transport factor 2 family protein [Xenophilus arseniciresistens]|uniref:Nuclear transport factor 2 family protein n=1 Tax=Xenophilus arseniciresistens TaxID=1283306 RepID=A0AAE3NDP4_9BURK|nr:aromatic-ring-hydroxylating dioxygenase subunit beta [Xenophilus arseniciresistens]MDA7417719.1 nuclear transport factor 2 family protein [Xenophilus arseniciresistens]
MQETIQSLVQRECRLLDEGRLDDWLQLYAQDATYWVPIDENADPLKESSVIFDDHLRLAMRVEQIMRQKRVSQTPGSQSMRMVSNLEVTDLGDGQAQARYAMAVFEVRSGDWRQQGLGQTRIFPGHCTMRFRQHEGDWKITNKTLVLLNRKQPIVGLSFIL